MAEAVAARTSLIEYPSAIAVRAMGLAAADFEALVQSLIAPHVEDLCESAISVRSSRGGKYASVSVQFTATSQSQLEAIYTALQAEPRVLFTL